MPLADMTIHGIGSNISTANYWLVMLGLTCAGLGTAAAIRQVIYGLAKRWFGMDYRSYPKRGW